MRYNPRIMYRGHSILGDKNSGYFSSVLGRDIHGKTISEVKDKIHRLQYGGLPRRRANPHRHRRRRSNPISIIGKNIVPIAIVGVGLFFLLRKKKDKKLPSTGTNIGR